MFYSFTVTKPISLLFSLRLTDYICGLQKGKECIKHGALNLTTNLYAKEFARREGERFAELNIFSVCFLPPTLPTPRKNVYGVAQFTYNSINATFTFLGLTMAKTIMWRAKYLEDYLPGNIHLNFRKVNKKPKC